MLWNLLWMMSSVFMSSPLPGVHTASGISGWNSTAIAAFADSVTGGSAHHVEAARDGRAGFELLVQGQRVPYSVLATFVLPGEELSLEVPSPEAYDVHAEAGSIAELGGNRWSWRAPDAPGLYPVRVGTDGGGEILLNVLVMVPYSQMKRGVLNGYRVGDYPMTWSKRAQGYERPRGFVKVTAENATALVAPHFQLGQFVCKQGAGFPKYVVLQPRLLIKLERLLESTQEHGVSASTFHLMSAYRTPVYNLGIGNKTTFSRHQYGDAADIFVDEQPADGVMDDLNGNGRHDRGDAALLMKWAEEIDRDPQTDGLVGGLSAYTPTHEHGAFVHVDARGYSARW